MFFIPLLFAFSKSLSQPVVSAFLVELSNRWEAKDRNLAIWIWKITLLCRWLSLWTGFPERLCSLLLWRYWKNIWTKCWVTCILPDQGGWVDSLQWFLPTLHILWFLVEISSPVKTKVSTQVMITCLKGRAILKRDLDRRAEWAASVGYHLCDWVKLWQKWPVGSDRQQWAHHNSAVHCCRHKGKLDLGLHSQGHC